MQKTEAKYRIAMLIDDSEIDNFINQRIIESSSFAEAVYVHTSGKSALELLDNLGRMESRISGRSLFPDFIFIDISMPIMDGFQFLDEYLKFNSELIKNTKVAILTSSLSPLDKVKASKYKCICSFISKPLNQDQLRSI